MRNLRRSTQIIMRCTPEERDNIRTIADGLELTITETFRQALTIAFQKTPSRFAWQRAFQRAKTGTPEKFLWTM